MLICSNPGVAAKLEQERRMRDSISGHKTGLPRKLLELFNPLPPVESMQPINLRKPKLPYTGIGQYVDLFAAPGLPPSPPTSTVHEQDNNRKINPKPPYPLPN